MEIKFTVQDRLILLASIQNQGNITTIRQKKHIIDQMSFSSEELKQIGLTQKDGKDFNWKEPNGGLIKDIELDSVEMQIIRDSLKLMDDTKQLTMQMIPLWEKFMEEKN